ASGVFVQLQQALNTIWQTTRQTDGSVVAVVRDRLISFGVVLGTGLLLLVTLVVSAALSALGKLLVSWAVPGGFGVWQAVNQAVSFGFVTLSFALIFKILPDAATPWRAVWEGAAATALLFTIGKYALGLYLGHSGTTSSFGAAASLVVILIWVY